jgi:large subunit ribosomal protein L21
MYAIVETGGKQYKVAEKNVLDVAPLAAQKGETVSFSQVMVLSGEGKILVGKPLVEGAEVKAVVVNHVLLAKIRGFKYKPKDTYSKRYGHRQHATRIRIEEIKWPEEGVDG